LPVVNASSISCCEILRRGKATQHVSPQTTNVGHANKGMTPRARHVTVRARPPPPHSRVVRATQQPRAARGGTRAPVANHVEKADVARSVQELLRDLMFALRKVADVDGNDLARHG
jgi:hypothetical protein